MGTVGEDGETDTEMGIRVTTALPDLLGSAVDVAFTVAVCWLGTTVGAV
jgi:hypothetical protein